MARSKSKKGSKENPLKPGELEELVKDERDYVILEATIKDGFCNYKYEIKQGTGAGDKHKVDGNGLAMTDLLTAISRLRVHLAIVDDVYKHSGVEIEEVDKFHNHELTNLYHVTGFKMRGSEGSEKVILIGNKFVSSSGGRIELVSPQVDITALSSYPWHEELFQAVETCRLEVSLYKEGKYIAPEEEEDYDNPKQMTIDQNIDEEEEHDTDEEENNDPGGKKIFIPGGFATISTKANDYNFDEDK